MQLKINPYPKSLKAANGDMSTCLHMIELMNNLIYPCNGGRAKDGYRLYMAGIFCSDCWYCSGSHAVKVTMSTMSSLLSRYFVILYGRITWSLRVFYFSFFSLVEIERAAKQKKIYNPMMSLYTYYCKINCCYSLT